MSRYSANMVDFGLDVGSLAGPLEAGLKIALDAGFSQITLSATDLTNYPGGVDAAAAAVRGSGLRITALQTLRDFEGLSGQLRAFKVDVAKAMLTMCQSVGCHQLLVSASTLAHAACDTATLVHDLRQLAMLGIPKNIKIAYQASTGGQAVKEFGQAWDLVMQADMPNLGLCLDTGDMLETGALPEEMDFLEPGKIFLVRLADSMAPSAPRWRVFPGEGDHSDTLAMLVSTLHGLGYRGDYNVAAFNDDYKQMPAAQVAQRAWDSALWLGQDVLQRSVPLPNQIRLKRALPV